MEVAIQTLNILLPFFYGTVVVLYGIIFFRSNHSVHRLSGKILVFTVVIHMVEILLRSYHLKYFPAASKFEIASLLALALALIYLFIETRLKIKSTGFFVLLLPFILQTVSSIFIDIENQIPEVLKTPMFVVHTSAATLGYCGLFIASFYSGMHLMLYYNLKRANFGNVYRKLPSLEEMASMSYTAAMLGFVFLTLTIFQGIMWRNIAYPGEPHFDPQIVASYVVWTIYGLFLIGKKTGIWSGKRLSYLALAGFLVIIISLVAVTKLTSFHQFG